MMQLNTCFELLILSADYVGEKIQDFKLFTHITVLLVTSATEDLFSAASVFFIFHQDSKNKIKKKNTEWIPWKWIE